MDSEESDNENESPASDRPIREFGGRYNDRADTNDRDTGLGAERYVRELREIGDRVREWAERSGIDKSTGSRERESRVGLEKIKRGESLLGQFWEKGFELTFESQSPEYRLAPSYIDLSFFAMQRGFKITGSNEKKGHNKNSKHYIGEAIDVRTWDKTPEQIDQYIHDARLQGYKVKDERKHPSGQKVWKGPHLHMEGGTRSREQRGQQPHRISVEPKDMSLPNHNIKPALP